MSRRFHAILAVVSLMLVGASSWPLDDHASDGPFITVEPARRIGFRLADGVRIEGDCVSWSAVEMDGTFGRRRWSDLHPDDVERVVRRLMDVERAGDWLVFGEILLRLDRDEHAERAFARARALDPDLSDSIDATRQRVERHEAEQEARRRAAEAARLSTRTPEARDWPPTPWPPLSPREQDQALLAVREAAEQVLREAGLPASPVESTHVLVYGDLERREAARWALRLDAVHETLARIVGLAPGTRLAYGKIAVLLLKSQDDFRLVQTQSFDHLPPRNVVAVAHPRGPMVLVSAWKTPDDRQLDAAVVHEFVHAFMHRYRTPRRLPAWANDGLAEYVTALVLEDSIVEERRRPAALRFIRGGGDVNGLLEQTYQGDWWPGPDQIGPAVGHLLVELMLNAGHGRFLAWVNAVKSGKDWQQALREDYGVSRSALVATFVQFYRVND